MSSKSKSKAQSIMTYAILLGVISMAVMTMQLYFRRAINARLEDVKEEFSGKAIEAIIPNDDDDDDDDPGDIQACLNVCEADYNSCVAEGVAPEFCQNMRDTCEANCY